MRVRVCHCIAQKTKARQAHVVGRIRQRLGGGAGGRARPKLFSPQTASHFTSLHHLVSSHLISSHLISSHLISSHLISSLLISCRLTSVLPKLVQASLFCVRGPLKFCFQALLYPPPPQKKQRASQLGSRADLFSCCVLQTTPTTIC